MLFVIRITYVNAGSWTALSVRRQLSGNVQDKIKILGLSSLLSTFFNLLSYSFLDGAVNAYGASLHLQRSLMKTYVQNSKLIMTFHISLHSGSTTAAFVPDSPPPQRCQNSVQKKWLRVRTRLCCVQGCSMFFFFFFTE